MLRIKGFLLIILTESNDVAPLRCSEKKALSNPRFRSGFGERGGKNAGAVGQRFCGTVEKLTTEERRYKKKRTRLPKKFRRRKKNLDTEKGPTKTKDAEKKTLMGDE
jgi:hypothetical protein